MSRSKTIQEHLTKLGVPFDYRPHLQCIHIPTMFQPFAIMFPDRIVWEDGKCIHSSYLDDENLENWIQFLKDKYQIFRKDQTQEILDGLKDHKIPYECEGDTIFIPQKEDFWIRIYRAEDSNDKRYEAQYVVIRANNRKQETHSLYSPMPKLISEVHEIYVQNQKEFDAGAQVRIYQKHLDPFVQKTLDDFRAIDPEIHITLDLNQYGDEVSASIVIFRGRDSNASWPNWTLSSKLDPNHPISINMSSGTIPIDWLPRIHGFLTKAQTIIQKEIHNAP